VNIGDYVQMNVGKPLKGFVVEPPPRAARLPWNKTSIWIFITKTPDGNFVGKIHPFQKHQIEVLSENR
jgi:hypothetical protein